ncbi:oxidoreductase, short chain dehydrogenase/reductase family protein [Necator americanus]|uniref:Oxidoreductase, short chain dehydrogenase/reductase family protein n=1 Tax=Necator americanus TaxID=51031 RepID=W2T223_NECAM|nr:oxidoreductase, short chain dehydrogenase/reductase family protein [Necator americanus]ETN76055.1 oxidoreductase, short chain dehydrogenase/reductase family protein [Necator americanus]
MSNCHRLEGKVAIVTAATKGIGLAIAERLGLEGAALVICSRNQKNVDEAVQYLRSRHIAKTIQKFGKIDILINNHGINPAFGHILEVDEKIWDKLFEVNVKAGWQLAKLVHPHMVKNGGGNIVFNASVGAYKSPPGIAAYAITKTTLLGLTKALANGLAKDNIRVNAIAPGVIKTKMSEMLWDGNGDEGEKQMVDTMEVPLGRLGIPEECAGAVAFLVSDDANYITGETILITGGVHARI